MSQIEKLVEDLLAQHAVNVSYDPAQRGPQVVTLTNGGIKPEGEPYQNPTETADEAIQGFLDHLEMLLNAKKGDIEHLKWRSKPEVLELAKTISEHGRYVVFSRLAFD